MEDLYRFLKDNQNLEFIIKQKDIEITGLIGEGGYGQVYRGKYMSCPVAVKDYMKTGRIHKSRGLYETSWSIKRFEASEYCSVHGPLHKVQSLSAGDRIYGEWQSPQPNPQQKTKFSDPERL